MSTKPKQFHPDAHHRSPHEGGKFGARNGFILDLGPASLNAIARAGERAPRGLDKSKARAWDFMWAVRRTVPTKSNPNPREIDNDDWRLGNALIGNVIPDSTIGHTYLLRSMGHQSHDHLVAFENIWEDEHGAVLKWKILKAWPVESVPPR